MSRRALALLVGAPLLALALGEAAARLLRPAPADVREARLRSGVRTLFEGAQRAAACALERGPEAAAGCAGARLGARIEGAGVVEAGRDYTRWSGTPAEIAGAGADEHGHAEIRTTGLRTSLVAVTPRDPRGRYAVASFLLTSPFDGMRLEEILPGAGGLTSADEVRFPASAGAGGDGAAEDAQARIVPIVEPAGAIVGEALLREAPPRFGMAAWRARGVAAAAALAVALIALFGPWGRLVRGRAGLVATVAAVAAGRVLILVAQVPERILPRDLASPSLYGAPGLAGLLSSPANLALTTLAALAVALAIRRHARGPVSPAGAVALSCAAGFGLAAWGLHALAASLATDARVPVLVLSAAAQSPGRAALVAGLAASVVAVAALGGAGAHAARRALGGRRVPARAVEIVLLAGTAILASASLQRTSDRLAIDRMRSEFGPRVIDQSAQRRVALLAAVRAAAQSESIAAALAPGASHTRGSAVYEAWLASPLFDQGYMSSLDLVDRNGVPRGHFAFALPPFGEPPPSRTRAEGEAEIREEALPLAATRQEYLHAEATVWVAGVPVGAVVGHVLDEPENLSFLPSVAPYLSAIGPGAARGGLAGAPDYVLYGPEGNVVLNTLPEPPAASEALRDAARRAATVEIVAGDGRWTGLPLRDGARLHLLLVPAHSPFDLLVAAVRLLAVLALAGGGAIVAAKIVRAGSPAALFATVRASFYRKLLAILLLASVVPLVGFALFLRGYVERRVEARFTEANAGVANAVRRVVEDYAAPRGEEAGASGPRLNDAVLSWLRGIVGQEIHLYQGGVLEATSKPELFASGLLLPRLPGDVQRALVEEGLPYLVRRERLGPTPLPVAYARVNLPGRERIAVVAVPLVVQQREVGRAVERVGEMLLLTTVLLTALLALAAAYVARSVARPVRGLVAATQSIARGDYQTRLTATSRDEIAALVNGFNAMAEALAAQRADLERRRDYMEALLGNATTGVVSTDAGGRVVTVNAAASSLIGAIGGTIAPGDTLVETVGRLASLAPLAEALRRPLPVRAEPEEVDLLVDGGARRIRLVRVVLPDPLGGPTGALHLVDDVTDLMRSNQLAAWAEMARAIAHEIKNPLTPIQLSTEHLQRILRDRGLLPSPDVEACLDTVLKQVRALREIAAEFGAYAKLPALSLDRVVPAEFLRETVGAYRAALPVGVSLEERYSDAPDIAIDRRVLARAVVNLIENALQAMPSGGRLTLACGSTEGGAEITVTDSGKGLSPDVRARLFEPYFSTKSSGTGLGLAIVRRAAEAHGGRVEFEDARGGGTTFRIVVPAAPPA